MKLARDSSILIAIPAMLVIAGAWWVATGGVSMDPPVGSRFALDGERQTGPRVHDLSFDSEFAPDGAMMCRTTGDDATVPAPAATLPEQALSAMWSGTVRARDGTPLADAIVRIRVLGARLGDNSFVTDSEWIAVTTGPDGVVAFPVQPGVRYQLEARAPGYGLERFDLQGQVNQDLMLDLASAVDGRVVGKNGVPIQGASVVFENANDERYEIVTDADGRFRFEGVGARAARILVAGEHFVATERGIESLAPGHAFMLGDLLVGQGTALSGSVVNGATQGPVAGADVTLRDRATGQLVSRGTSDGFGRFLFTSINPLRQYVVSASGTGFRFDSLPQFFNAEPMTLTLVPTWTLGVSVRNEVGAPLANARIQLKRADGLPLSGTQMSVLAWTNGSGAAAFGGLSASLAYRLVIARDGYATMDLGPATASWNATQPLVVAMVPGRTVSGVVTDEDGTPVAGVTVRAQRTDGAPAPALFNATGPDGTFSFDALYPGGISLVTFKSGFDNTRVLLGVPASGAAPHVPIVISLLNGLIVK